MGQACQLHVGGGWGVLAPGLKASGAAGALYSPHELRVESREAIPRSTHWLQQQGVQFEWGQEVLAVEGGVVQGAQGEWHAERIVVCPGTELNGLVRRLLPGHGLQLTRLQMLRVRPQAGLRLAGAVMSDLSLERYRGYADLASAVPLRAQLLAECPQSLADGVHLIVVQSADGSLVVGDSHHAHDSPDPFASEAVDLCILQHLREVVDLKTCEVLERWIGVYPTGHTDDCLVAQPSPDVRLVLVTSGTGASTAFGIAEETFHSW